MATDKKPLFNYLTTLDHFRIEFVRTPLRQVDEYMIDCMLARHEAREVAFTKRCGCGASYDLAGWLALPLVGYQKDEVETLEIRNCPCRSSIAVVLHRDGRRSA